MCYKNTEYAPNIDYNRIPRQNTHSHIILKLQSPNYYYDSMNIKVTIKTTISNHRNETAIIFKEICDVVITSYSKNIFSMGTLLRKLSQSSINMTDFYAILDIAAKFFKNRKHFNNSKRCFSNEYQTLMSPAIQYNSFQRVHFLQKLSKSLINMTDLYATPDFSANFSRMELLKQRQISYQPNATAMILKRVCYADITNYPIKLFSTGTPFTNVIKIIDQHDRFYATLAITGKFFKNRTHFNNSRFLIMCYNNTEKAPNIHFNRIPRQNTHSHIILKLQSPNYY